MSSFISLLSVMTNTKILDDDKFFDYQANVLKKEKTLENRVLDLIKSNTPNDKILKTILSDFDYNNQPDIITKVQILIKLLKIRESRKGRKEISFKINKLDEKGNITRTYKSLREASRHEDVHASIISNICLGKRESYKGRKWSYNKTE